jgi:competence protein ComFB
MEVVLKNMMEDLVIEKLDELGDNVNCCKCPKCRMDIVSYALNRLPPKYVASYKGEVYSKLDTLSLQYDADLLNAIYQAAEVVNANPRHKLEE